MSLSVAALVAPPPEVPRHIGSDTVSPAASTAAAALAFFHLVGGRLGHQGFLSCLRPPPARSRSVVQLTRTFPRHRKCGRRRVSPTPLPMCLCEPANRIQTVADEHSVWGAFMYPVCSFFLCEIQQPKEKYF